MEPLLKPRSGIGTTAPHLRALQQVDDNSNDFHITSTHLLQSLDRLDTAMKRHLASPNPDALADNGMPTFKRWKQHNLDTPHIADDYGHYRHDEDVGVEPEPASPIDRAFKRYESAVKLHSSICNRRTASTAFHCMAQSVLPSTGEGESSGELETPPSPEGTADCAQSPLPSVRQSKSSDKLKMPPQRSSSPVRKSSAEYRAMNMARANMFVDHLPEPPATIDVHLERIFGGVTWAAEEQRAMEELAVQYWAGSRTLAKKCAPENEWRSQLYSALRSRDQSGKLMLSEPEKPWLPTLIPTFLYCPDNPNEPKPDITFGLANKSFSYWQRNLLNKLQNAYLVASDPHQAQIGLRFPFLLIKSKGGAVSGDPIRAQNQAATDGACALTILRRLQNLVTRYSTHSGTDQGPLFSVAIEGPLHEIWVHYRVGAEYHMTCHRVWRTTRLEDAREFIQALAAIVEWGKTGFRKTVVDSLRQLKRAEYHGDFDDPHALRFSQLSAFLL